ncbi:MAG: DUF4383 domain-containing protein [Bdellovibrionales bacterium]|nr:DUF4383 domain-containing protein [Oligoflexia bacterium]
MQVRKFAFSIGWVMLTLGVFALIPGLYQLENTNLPALNLEASYGLFLGFIPLNIMNKLALIGFGLAGIAANTKNNPYASVQYSRVLSVAMGLLAVLGLIPASQTLGGYWPLFGADIAVHAIIAGIAGYFGFVKKQARVADVIHTRFAA